MNFIFLVFIFQIIFNQNSTKYVYYIYSFLLFLHRVSIRKRKKQQQQVCPNKFFSFVDPIQRTDDDDDDDTRRRKMVLYIYSGDIYNKKNYIYIFETLTTLCEFFFLYF